MQGEKKQSGRQYRFCKREKIVQPPPRLELHTTGVDAQCKLFAVAKQKIGHYSGQMRFT